MKKRCLRKELSWFMYWDVNNLYDWAMSQILPVDAFNWNMSEWVKSTSQFNELFIKTL